MPPGDARFDADTGSWILSRYADVVAALHEPQLVASGTTAPQQPAHSRVRDALSQALSPDHLAVWRAAAMADACRIVDTLPDGQPFDLVQCFAQPWSLQLACAVTGTWAANVAEATQLARQIFLAAAGATNGAPSDQSQRDSAQLAQLLASGATPLRATADVQTFVALSQTLPHLLASVWLTLLSSGHNSALLRELKTQPERLPLAVGELLRVAGPSRAVFREALADVEIAGAHIRTGDRVTLMLSAANQDPSRFANPDRLDVHRANAGHLAFGAGPHACAGAALVRMSVAVATEALITRTTVLELVAGAHAVEWTDGFAIRAPRALLVVLTR